MTETGTGRHSGRARLLLAVVGSAYVLLAVWCAVLPQSTAQSVGFVLLPGSGESEYFVVYGGLQLALGIVFLWPIRWPRDTDYALRLCCLVHGCLVVFRTASLIRFDHVGATTLMLAAAEWMILVGAVAVWSRCSRSGMPEADSAPKEHS